jgi:hypothetical protein
MQATVRIKGMAELTRRLREVKAAIGDTLEEAGTKWMLVAEGEAPATSQSISANSDGASPRRPSRRPTTP